MIETPDSLIDVQALLFDVFGTVVDWFGSVSRQIDAFARTRGLDLDGAELARAWRATYGPAMAAVVSGTTPWRNIDALHEAELRKLLEERGVSVSEEELRAMVEYWHALDGWPDVAAGLDRLRARFIVGTLSNGNVSLLLDTSRHAGLRWDVILSAELVRRYKHDLDCYRDNLALIGRQPGQVAMVAAHLQDLSRAAAVGMATCYVPRPAEFGRNDTEPSIDGFEPDVVAPDFLALADALGC